MPRRLPPTALWWAVAVGAVALAAVLAALRPASPTLRGDEGSYVAMAESLARDGDLRFDEADATRARARPGGLTVILQRTGRGVVYSKPILYPLLAAPVFALAGEAGLPVFNALVVLLALALARALLVRVGAPPRATATVIVFAAASIVLPWIGWKMSESLVVALALAGLALALAAERPATAPPRGLAGRLLAGRAAALAGALLLGLLVSLREPHAAIAGVPALAALLRGRLAAALRSAAGVAFGYAAVLALTWALTGAINPYKAVRTTFNAETGYPAGGAPAAMARFERPDDLATSSLALRPVWQPRNSLYAALYFVVGRHSGLLAYLPLALLLLVLLARRGDAVSAATLAGFAVLALFYLVWWPANYFGGETFIGNRYLLAGYAALLAGVPRLPSARQLAAVVAVAALFGLSALESVRRTAGVDATSQSHAHAGLFRLLPYESTASNIDGRRDRYWSGDFVRFVDPFAAVGPQSFELRAGAPPAELEIATRRRSGEMNWLVTTDAPRATLVVRDWRRTRRLPLGETPGGGAGGLVSVRLAPAWRVHPFWWSQGESVPTRLVRLALETPDGAPATARLRHLGRGGLPGRPARELLAAGLPVEGIAGGRGHVHLELRNSGRWDWARDGVLPVLVGWRLRPAGGGQPVAQGRAPLPHRVAAGRPVAIDFELDWPAATGAHQLEVDLLIEDLFWFADRVGAPLAGGPVDLRPADPVRSAAR